MKRLAVAGALALAACGSTPEATVVAAGPANDTNARTYTRWERGEEFHPPQTTTTARASRSSRPRPAPVPAGRRAGEHVPHGDVFDALAKCESGGNPRAVSPSGLYYGAFQFALTTWRSVGGTGNPIEHSYEHQKALARKLQARSGWSQWPACSRKLGLRG